MNDEEEPPFQLDDSVIIYFITDDEIELLDEAEYLRPFDDLPTDDMMALEACLRERVQRYPDTVYDMDALMHLLWYQDRIAECVPLLRRLVMLMHRDRHLVEHHRVFQLDLLHALIIRSGFQPAFLEGPYVILQPHALYDLHQAVQLCKSLLTYSSPEKEYLEIQEYRKLLLRYLYQVGWDAHRYERARVLKKHK